MPSDMFGRDLGASKANPRHFNGGSSHRGVVDDLELLEEENGNPKEV